MALDRTYHNIIKAIYDKPTANIIFNGEKLKAFPPRWGTRQEWPPTSFLLNRVLEVLAKRIREKEEIKALQIGKSEVILSLFVEGFKLYIENPKSWHQKTSGVHQWTE